MHEELERLSRLLDAGLAALRDQAHEYADAEQEYREAKARAWVEVRGALPDGTVPERDAWVGGVTAVQRRRRDLADGMRQAALEAVRSRRGQISAMQTLANVDRAELELARTGPEMTP